MVTYLLFSLLFLSTDGRTQVETEPNPKSICYILGLQTITIFQCDSICKVIIESDNKDRVISTTCEAVPILQWAFNEITEEMPKQQFTSDDEYHLLYFKLSLKEDGRETIIDSASMHITDNKELTTKINELKKFIANLWLSEFLNSLDNN